MDFNLTREQEMLRDMVREFAQRELAPKALALDAKGEFIHDIIKKTAELGLVGIITSKEFGGTGMGHLARMLMIEELSRIYASLGFFFQTGQIGMYAIENFGTPEQKQKYLPALCKADKIISTALTEAGGGSDPSAIQTTAELKGDEYIINGRKVMISEAPVCDLAIIVAKTGDKFSAFIVEKGTPGFTTSGKENYVGLRSLPVGDLVFTNCKVPKANLLGQEGKGLAVAIGGISAVGRTGVAGVALGTAEGAYAAAVKYAKERKLYGKPIAELQAIQYMLVDCNMEIETARWLCYKAAVLLDQGKSPRDAGDDITRCKLYSCDIASKVALRAIQIMGGYGTIPQYEITRRLNDSIELFTAAGTQEIMKNTLARSIIA
ncbi:MAG: acyl-CoA dehydrogenase family protein [Dehalococcoidales bacterium]|nr:acyl-CoA dehydrogenase family protein [Dehalococcoidales bacterium]